MKVAAIDIGSNAVRLTIAEVDGINVKKHIFRKRNITRLGAGVKKTGRLSLESMYKTVETLKDFKQHIDEHNVDRIAAVATSAVRESLNKGELIQAAADIGIGIQVIDGETEAMLSFDGAMSGLELKEKNTLMIDVGGGSTEIIYWEPGKEKPFVYSVPLGVVKLADSYDFKKILDMETLDMINIPVFSVFNEVFKNIECKPEYFVASAGTPTTLAAIDMGMTEYDPEQINGYVINEKRIREIQEYLSGMKAEDRISVSGMEAGREDLIIPGIIITTTIMGMTGVKDMIVADYGLREGLAIAAANF